MTTLTASGLRQVMIVYHRLLGDHRQHLNALNVYPVPDADTGTNLTSTLQGVIEALPPDLGSDPGMPAVCVAIQRGAMLGARGASGVITSQLLGALAKSFEEEDAIDGARLAEGLHRATDAAYRAVLHPVEGTILTVLREAASAAERAAHGGSLAMVLEAARAAGADTLAATPERLPALKAAGVVDAGGSGLLLLLDALLHVVASRPLPAAPDGTSRSEPADPPEGMPRHEVVVRLTAAAEMMDDFRTIWDRLGNNSTIVVESRGEWVCHIHTDHPEAAIEAARAAGEIRQVEVTDLVDQILELRASHRGSVAVVAVAVGVGTQRRLLDLGATGIVSGGPSRNPSPAELLQAIDATGADTVVLLPNDENVIPACNQVVELTERRVLVVPANSLPAGVAALEAHDPNAADGAVARMRDAAAAVAAGDVTQAVRDADTPIGRIAAGTWIVRTAGTAQAAQNLEQALSVLIDRLTAEVTPRRIQLITGAGSDEAVTENARRRIAARWPRAELTVSDGGQPYSAYLVGVEPA